MTTHAKRTSRLSKLAIWASTKWRARRARRIEEETLLSLSALEPKLLNDIGLDIGNLSASLESRGHVIHQGIPSSQDAESRAVTAGRLRAKLPAHGAGDRRPPTRRDDFRDSALGNADQKHARRNRKATK